MTNPANSANEPVLQCVPLTIFTIINFVTIVITSVTHRFIVVVSRDSSLNHRLRPNL